MTTTYKTHSVVVTIKEHSDSMRAKLLASFRHLVPSFGEDKTRKELASMGLPAGEECTLMALSRAPKRAAGNVSTETRRRLNVQDFSTDDGKTRPCQCY